MRADRLVATLLLLQTRGTVTAREVAEELEVSERTARRDLDALGVAGIPVYSQQGRGGGWRLIGGATTDLTGLRTPEARALMTMAVAAGQITPEFSSAMRKLLQALPEPVRIEAKRAIDSVVADPTSWGNPNSVLIEPRRNEWIEPLQAAVIGCRTVELAYDTPRKGRSDRRINPLGLVVKQGVWYVLAVTDAGQRSFRVDRIVDVAVTDERFVRPDDFDLQQAWEAITTGYVERSSRVTIEAIATDYALPALRALGVETILHGEQPDGRWRVTLGAWNSDVLSAEISGVIGFLELIDPPDAVVSRLAEIGSELVSRFGTPPDR
jgi:predicted DNA-binding transcriptional regulator YafY